MSTNPFSKLPPAYFVASHGQRYTLDKATLVIGRVDDNDIPINDTRVSRRHAQVRREDYRYYIEDLDSTNGTWLNGARLSAAAQLRNGDQVRIADVTLVFHDPNTTIQAEAFQALRLDETRGLVHVGEQAIRLTAKELALMRLLIQHAGALCPKDLIAQAVWPEYHGEVSDYNIEGLISRVRHKIEPNPEEPIYLRTERGLGYMLVLAGLPPPPAPRL